MEKHGFIYIWYDKGRKMYYIGCHWGHENDGYKCSSNRMRDALRRRPNDFKRRIIKRNIPRESLLNEEHKWLTLIPDDELGNKYYNFNKYLFGHWSSDPKKAMSLREQNLGSNNPMFGKPAWNRGLKASEETRAKMRIARARQVFSPETRKKMADRMRGENNCNYGKTLSDETKAKISASSRNRPKRTWSDEQKQAMSIAAKKRIQTPNGQKQWETCRAKRRKN